MTERSFNLVVPLAHEATAMRTTETAGSSRARSGAVTPLSIRPGDVESTMGPSPAGLGIRTSTTATRTTTTRTTASAPEPSADWAATFRDRVVHHLFHNRVAPRFYARFIADSCACIPGRGIRNGVAAYVDRISAIGNGQVPLVAATAWRILTHNA